VLTLSAKSEALEFALVWAATIVALERYSPAGDGAQLA
jgi:hypothetical protein